MNELSIGYACCFVSILGFGSSYVPVKKVVVKDGVFFSFSVAVGIFLVGLIQWAAFGFYKIEPFAFLGGMVWATANACVPFIITRCGLGAGQLVWSVTNMLTGWATGTFGLFGKEKDHVEHREMNIAGVVVVILSLVAFTLMEKNGGDSADQNSAVPSARELEAALTNAASGTAQPGSRKFVGGFIVALVAGCFMGSGFDAATYLQQIGPPAHSSDPMQYVFSHFCGILLLTTAYFLGYLVVKGDRKYVPREVVFPGMLSGVIWAIAQTGWFQANVALSYVVTFPLIVAVPGLLAAVWGVVLFGENRGVRNMSVLAVVVLLQVFGVGLITASKGSA